MCRWRAPSLVAGGAAIRSEPSPCTSRGWRLGRREAIASVRSRRASPTLRAIVPRRAGVLPRSGTRLRNSSRQRVERSCGRSRICSSRTTSEGFLAVTSMICPGAEHSASHGTAMFIERLLLTHEMVGPESSAGGNGGRVEGSAGSTNLKPISSRATPNPTDVYVPARPWAPLQVPRVALRSRLAPNKLTP